MPHRGFVRRLAYGPEDVEYDILAVLWDAPRQRTEIVRAVGDRRGTLPHPREVYPPLQMLADGDFVRTSTNTGDQRLYTLTQKGSDLLAERAAFYETALPRAHDPESCPVARGMMIVRILAHMASRIARQRLAR